MLRFAASFFAVAALGAGCVLAWIAIVAARRHEGVFMPAGYVSIICFVLGAFLLRYAITAE